MTTPDPTEQPSTEPSAPPVEVPPVVASPPPAAVDAAPDASSDASEGDDAGDDDAAAPGNEAGEEAPAAAAGDGAPHKRKRRRRRKRGGHGAAAADGAAPGPAVEGEAAADAAPGNEKPAHEKKKREHPPRPERERPPFGVGDVTFGKILEIGDDAIFVDLSGKAKAIFDIRELLLPADYDNEPVEEPTEADEGAHDPPVDAEPHTDTPVDADAHADAASRADDAAPATASPADADAVTPAADAASADAPEPRPDPQLPTVILEVGAQFVGVVHNDGGRGGLVVLTHHPKRVSRAKVAAARALKEHALVWGLVTGVIKGGLDVDLEGLRAFAPASHVSHYLGADLTPLVGKRLDFYVTQYKKRGRDVVVSRKPLLEAEAKRAREEALAKLEVGAVVDGVVRSVVSFGAFIDIGGIEGLVPLPEMSHNRADTPSDVFKAGETVAVKVMKLDDRGKVWLSRKAAIADPWGEVAKKYAVGTKHTGKIVRIQPFGAFVELEGGIDGLIHAADLVLPGPNGLVGMKRVDDIAELVKVGDTLEVVVAQVESGAHRIALHPALAGDMANEAPQKIVQGKMVKAVVFAAEPGGVLVRILGATGRNARGYVTGAGTGTQRGTDLRKHFPVNMPIEAKVLEIDPRRGEIKLSIKALNDETERHAFQQYRAQVKTAARFTLGDLLQKKK